MISDQYYCSCFIAFKYSPAGKHRGKKVHNTNTTNNHDHCACP